MNTKIVDVSQLRRVELIKRATYCTIYLAVHEITKEKYVIKEIIINPQIQNHEISCSNFYSYISSIVDTMTCILHPTIHRILGFSLSCSNSLFDGYTIKPLKTNNTPFFKCPEIVTEYMKNQSTAELIEELKQKNVPEKLPTILMKIIYGTAFALNLLHLHNPIIIHQNVKPSSILLNENYEPCISDFGINFQSISTLSSLRFLAPEVIKVALNSDNESNNKGNVENSHNNVNYNINNNDKNDKVNNKDNDNNDGNDDSDNNDYDINDNDNEDNDDKSNKKRKRSYNNSNLSYAVDVYSFGMVLVNLFTLNLPFSEIPNDNIFLKSVVAGIKMSLPKTAIPKAYRRLIRACTNSVPKKRPHFSDILCKLDTSDYKLSGFDETEFGEYRKRMIQTRPIPCKSAFSSRQSSNMPAEGEIVKVLKVPNKSGLPMLPSSLEVKTSSSLNSSNMIRHKLLMNNKLNLFIDNFDNNKSDPKKSNNNNNCDTNFCKNLNSNDLLRNNNDCDCKKVASNVYSTNTTIQTNSRPPIPVPTAGKGGKITTSIVFNSVVKRPRSNSLSAANPFISGGHDGEICNPFLNDEESVQKSKNSSKQSLPNNIDNNNDNNIDDNRYIKKNRLLNNVNTMSTPMKINVRDPKISRNEIKYEQNNTKNETIHPLRLPILDKKKIGLLGNVNNNNINTNCAKNDQEKESLFQDALHSEKGDTVYLNVIRSFKLFKDISDMYNHSPSQLYLGKKLLKGIGVKRDVLEAEKYLRMSTNQGNITAASLLAYEILINPPFAVKSSEYSDKQNENLHEGVFYLKNALKSNDLLANFYVIKIVSENGEIYGFPICEAVLSLKFCLRREFRPFSNEYFNFSKRLSPVELENLAEEAKNDYSLLYYIGILKYKCISDSDIKLDSIINLSYQQCLIKSFIEGDYRPAFDFFNQNDMELSYDVNSRVNFDINLCDYSYISHNINKNDINNNQHNNFDEDVNENPKIAIIKGIIFMKKLEVKNGIEIWDKNINMCQWSPDFESLIKAVNLVEERDEDLKNELVKLLNTWAEKGKSSAAREVLGTLHIQGRCGIEKNVSRGLRFLKEAYDDDNYEMANFQFLKDNCAGFYEMPIQ